MSAVRDYPGGVLIWMMAAMEWGFSLISQTAIYAENIAHGDASRLQIICPVCSEALFLRIRTKPRLRPYLAHYRRAGAEDADCELRVLSMPRPALQEPKHTVPRDQELARFFGEFESYATATFSDSARVQLLRVKAHMQQRQVYRDFLRMFRNDARQIIKTASFDEVMRREPDLRDSPEKQEAVRQTFAFLLAPNSFEPLIFSAAYGILHLLASTSKMVDEGHGDRRGPSDQGPTVESMREASRHVVFDSQRELIAYFRNPAEFKSEVLSVVHLGALLLTASMFVNAVSKEIA